MVPALRREKLLNIIKENESMMLNDIVAAMQNSESTVRRDLKCLAAEGKISLLRGGCIKVNKAKQSGIQAEIMTNTLRKLKIAQYAGKLILKGDIVFLDNSAINYLLIDCIKENQITVVTNSVPNAEKLHEKNIPAIMIGGQVDSDSFSCEGPIALQIIENMRFTKCFLDAAGVSADAGITCKNPREKAVKQLAIKNSSNVYFLAESDKFGRVEMCSVCPAKEHAIIADRLPDEYAKFESVLTADETINLDKN